MPNAIKIEGETFNMKVTWEKQFKIVEKINYFLIYPNYLSAIIIPKKDLRSDDINNFSYILKDLVKVPVTLMIHRREALNNLFTKQNLTFSNNHVIGFDKHS